MRKTPAHAVDATWRSFSGPGCQINGDLSLPSAHRQVPGDVCRFLKFLLRAVEVEPHAF